MKHANNAKIVGVLPRDPFRSVVRGNLDMLKFTVTIDKPRGGSDFFSVTAFGDTATLFDHDPLKAMDIVQVEGPVSMNEYTDKTGVKRASLQIVAKSIVNLSRPTKPIPVEEHLHAIREAIDAPKTEFTEDDIPF